MRISDWSSDVCSSDLRVRSQPKLAVGLAFVERGIERDIELRRGQPLQRPRHVEPRMRVAAHLDSPLARREVEVQQRRPAQSRSRLPGPRLPIAPSLEGEGDRKSTRLNYSH